MSSAMSTMVIPSTPNRKPTYSPPRTPSRPRAERTPLSAASPNIVTPVTPSPSRYMRCGGELEFHPRVARRLFFTPQYGSQSHIPPSPPLTPTTLSGAHALVPLHAPHHSYAPIARPTDTTASMPSTPFHGSFELGSPVPFQHKNKKSKIHHH